MSRLSIGSIQILSQRDSYGMQEIEVAPSDWSNSFKVLIDEGYLFLTDLCGMHFPHSERQFSVVAHVHDLVQNRRLRVKTVLEQNTSPQLDSLTPLFAGANWMERETYDFYGIRFVGHPNLKRILNTDDMDVFPMRKDYPLEDATRDDKVDGSFGR